MNRPSFWTIEFFVDPVTGACPVVKFLDRLPDAKFAAIDVAFKYILEPSGISLGGSPWLKAECVLCVKTHILETRVHI